jgi:hypothetical protein
MAPYQIGSHSPIVEILNIHVPFRKQGKNKDRSHCSQAVVGVAVGMMVVPRMYSLSNKMAADVAT